MLLFKEHEKEDEKYKQYLYDTSKKHDKKQTYRMHCPMKIRHAWICIVLFHHSNYKSEMIVASFFICKFHCVCLATNEIKFYLIFLIFEFGIFT